MAVSYSLFSLYAYPARIHDHRKVADALAPILHQTAVDLSHRLDQSYRVVRIADNLDRKQAETIKRLGIDGISCRRSEARFYPENTAAAQIIGYAGDGVGLAGVERRYDIVLQPGGYTAGDLPGIDLPAGAMAGRMGSDLILTIDLDLQRALDQFVRDIGAKEEGRSRIVGMVLDPGNGAILAASGLPAFNPNYFWQAERQSRCNGLAQPLFSLQSIRPLLVRAAARLREGVTDLSLLPETIAAPDYGIEPIELDAALKRLAILRPVVDPLRDKAGDESTDRRGGRLSLLQIGVSLASLVNGGWRHDPKILDSLYDLAERKRLSLDGDRFRPRHLLSPAMGVLMRRDLLNSVTKRGNRKRDFLYVRDVARMSGQGAPAEYNREQLLVGMVPVKHPRLLVVVGLRRDYLRPDAASPERGKLVLASRKLLSRLASLDARAREKIARHPNGKDEQNYKRFLVARRMEFTPREKEQLTRNQDMPRLIGFSLRKGMRHLNGRNLVVKVRGSGRIVAQSPSPGTPLAGIRVCRLTLDSRI